MPKSISNQVNKNSSVMTCCHRRSLRQFPAGGSTPAAICRRTRRRCHSRRTITTARKIRNSSQNSQYSFRFSRRSSSDFPEITIGSISTPRISAKQSQPASQLRRRGFSHAHIQATGSVSSSGADGSLQ